MLPKKIKVGSLFAGIGGICQGFKETELCDILWANEIDANACITYKLNHPNTLLIEKDIKLLSNNDLQKVDILTAGFPCQPFSQAGHGKGFDDERGKLFFEATRIINELKPKVFLLENVRTLATHNRGKTFEVIRKEIKKINYSFIPFILNASKVTKVPQGRERIYIVGFKDEGDFYYIKPVKNNEKNNERFPLSSSFRIPIENNNQIDSLKKYLAPSSVQPNDYYKNKDNHIHRKIIENVISEKTVYQYRRYYVRENKSNVCPTLTANMGSGGHNVPIILDNGTPRRLTPKECFNFQGFPKDYKLPNNLSKSKLYKQAGNSVVVPVIKLIADEIIRVLYENNASIS